MLKNYVYFLYDDETNLIKIGQSRHPDKRRREIERDKGRGLSIMATIEDRMPLEFELHKRFSDLCADGEWFRPDEELLQYIEAHEGRPDLANRPLRMVLRHLTFSDPDVIDYLASCDDGAAWHAVTWLVYLLAAWTVAGVCLARGLASVSRFLQTANHWYMAGGVALFILVPGLALLPIVSWIVSIADHRRFHQCLETTISGPGPVRWPIWRQDMTRALKLLPTRMVHQSLPGEDSSLLE